MDVETIEDVDMEDVENGCHEEEEEETGAMRAAGGETIMTTGVPVAAALEAAAATNTNGLRQGDDKENNGGIVTSSLDAERQRETTKAKEMRLEERFAHKNWKVRAEAYEAANEKALTSSMRHPSTHADTEMSPNDTGSAKHEEKEEEEDVAPMLAKAMSDSNAPAQEKALELACTYLRLADDAFAARYAKPMMKAVVGKCFNGRIGTVNRATEAAMLLIELGASEEVVAAFLSGTQSKQAKVVLASLTAIGDAVNAFGANVVGCKAVIKELPRLFDSRDGKVRDRAKEVTVDLCMWLGLDTMRELLLDKMRDAMRKDVEVIVEERRSSDKKRPTRRLRRDMHAEKSGDGDADDVANNDDAQAENTETAVPDAYDLSDGVNVLAKLNDSWFTRLNEPKWSDRKAALHELTEHASSVPRIEPGDFGAVVNAIERLMKNDSNVAVVTEAVAAVSALSKGLRKSFAGNARTLLPYVIDKLKEKGVALISGCQKLLRVWSTYCVELADVIDEVGNALKHKVPKVRKETLEWVADAVDSSETTQAAKLHKTLVPTLVAVTTDSAAEVRDAAVKAIIAFVIKAGGIKGSLAKAIQGLDERQMKKVKESVGDGVSEEAQKSASSNRTSSSTGAAKASALSDKSTNIQSGTKTTAKSSITDARSTASKTRATTTSSSTTRTGSSRPKAGTGKRRPAASAKQKKGGDECVEPILADRSAEEVEDIAAEMLGEANIALIKSSNWKERLDGVSNVSDWASQSDREVTGSQMECLASFLCRHPSWDDKNVQVLSRLTESFVALSALRNFGKKAIYIVMNGKCPASEKLSDTKLKAKTGEMFSAFAEVVGLKFIIFLLRKAIGDHKNPKVIAEGLGWLSRALEEFGMAGVTVKDLVEWMRKALDSSNPTVRSSAIKVLGVIHRTVGSPLMGMLGDIKSSLATTISKEFEKNPQGSSAEPVRKVRGAAAAAAQSTGLDKVDISDKITTELLAELSSQQWKERAAALEQIDGILAAAGGCIAPDVGDLVKALQLRLSDRNKNLVVVALNTVAKLASAMGKAFEQSGFKVIASAVVKTLNDIKKNVREAGCSALSTFTDVVSVNRVLHFVFDTLAEKKFGPDGKRESMIWIQSQSEKLDASSPFLPTIFKQALEGMEDRAGDVREASVGVIKVYAATQKTAFIKFFKQQLSAQQAMLQPYLCSDSASDDSGGAETGNGYDSEHNDSVADGQVVTGKHSSPSASPTRPSTAPARSGSHLRSSRAGGSRGARSSLTATPSSSKATSKDPTISGPLFKSDKGIEDRIHKLSRRSGKGWDPEISLRPEALDDLERDLGNAVREDLCALMKSTDFRQHCKAIDMLITCVKAEPQLLLSNRDYVFKWLVYRVCEGNTTSLVKSLELCSEMLSALKSNEIRLTNGEALILLPCLVEKSGHNSDRVRGIYRGLMKQWTSVYPVSLVCVALLDGVSYSKNNRTRVECVESYAENLERHGLECADRGGKGLSMIAGLVSERDMALRGAALAALATVYRIQGDAAWKLLGNLTDAQKSLIDDKFKWTAKDMRKTGSNTVVAPSAAAAPPKAGGSIHSAGPRSMTASVGPHAGTPATEMAAATSQPVGLVHDAAAENPAQTQVAAPQDPHAEMIEQWERAMRIVGSTDTTTEAVEGMRIVCMTLNNPNLQRDLLLRYSQDANTLVEILARQISRTFSAAAEIGDSACTRSIRYVLNAVMITFSVKEMAEEVTEGVHRDLAMKAVFWMLHPLVRSRRLHHGEAILGALLALMKKVATMSRKTVTFCSLIHLLKPSSLKAVEAAAIEGSANIEEYKKVLVKCAVIPTRTIATNLSEVNIERILLAIHGFFDEVGSDEEMRRRRATSSKSDLTVKCVKTILHEMVKVLGSSIRDYMTSIPTGSDTDPCPLIHAYVDLNIKNLAAAAAASGGSSGSDTASHGADTVAGAGDSTPQMTPLTRRTNSHLAMSNVKKNAASAVSADGAQHSTPNPNSPRNKELVHIFRRIGDKRRTSQGLEELHAFQELHRGYDISPHLDKTSSAFRDYILRGVRRVGVAKASPDHQREAQSMTLTDDASRDVIAEDSQLQKRQEEEPENADGNRQSVGVAPITSAPAPVAADAAAVPESAPVLHDASNKSAALASTRSSRAPKAHGLNLESLQSRMEKIRRQLDCAAGSDVVSGGHVKATTERFHAIQEQNRT